MTHYLKWQLHLWTSRY